MAILSIVIIAASIIKEVDYFYYILFSDNDSSGSPEKDELILHDKIRPKKMFYNQRESQAITMLNSLLSEENYSKVINRLDNKGMRKGFACLFSGGPGTGKTETAYQIARQTRRHIMTVDISQTKNREWGADEKHIKKIFDSYRSLVEKSEITPILLFNESDSVINKRTELGQFNRAIDKSENNVQNIILQEIENLNGILIATTNLARNMDTAFERRFLYRINFDKPTAESRNEIWKMLMPQLPEELCRDLSNKYELSGGQIENIARKAEVNMVLNNDVLPMATLVQYCIEESQSSISTTEKIGFGRV
ncbi:MAG: ATP-binding protein [Treponema sp.]|nr:ATP-binding protein [Treponema sp.]